MSMSYEEAFASNFSAWMRRANLTHDKSRNEERAIRAKKAMGESSRLGALFVVVAIYASTKFDIKGRRECHIFSSIAALALFMRVYENKEGTTLSLIDFVIQNRFAENDRDEAIEVFLKNAGKLHSMVEWLNEARTFDKKHVSVANVVLDKARGKVI